MKTRKALKGKFKVTGTGKILRTHPGRRHKLIKKSSNRKRRLSKKALVSEGQLHTYKRLIEGF